MDLGPHGDLPEPGLRGDDAARPLVLAGKKKGKEGWVRPVVEGTRVRFEIGSGKGGPPVEGTVGRQGATCIVCESPVPFTHVRAEGQAGRMGAQLMAVVAEGNRQRIYLPPTPEHEQAAAVERPDDVPDSALPEKALGFRVQQYGMTHHADLFTNRQLVALTTFSDLVGEARAQVALHAHLAGMDAASASQYADAVALYLALSVDRVADLSSALASWIPQLGAIRNTFARQTLSMVWDFAECHPEADKFSGAYGWVASVIAALPAREAGQVGHADARHIYGGPFAVCTDPPYYDNVGYADLSDFFYVWLRRSLGPEFDSAMSTVLAPKDRELIADPHRRGGARPAIEYFEHGFVEVFDAIRHCIEEVNSPLTFFYAFKQAEAAGDGSIASTGWVTMLSGLLASGLAVTGTWPMRTERDVRMRGIESNALASSIVVVCRPRPTNAGVTDRRGFVNAMKAELPSELKKMQQAAIAPVDLAQAAIGPGMAVFSRYARVIEPSGEAMSVRTALGLINQVLAEVLDEQEGEFDPSTQWAIKWFEQHGLDEGRFGDANQLANAMGIAVDGLERDGIVASGRGKVRLLGIGDLPDGWDPAADVRVPVWEATHHLCKQLLDHGEEAAGRLLARLGGVGDACQALAYRLYSLAERKRPALAGPYNALGASWSEIARHAATQSPAYEQPTLG